jgi:FkbM family methyltransferase
MENEIEDKGYNWKCYENNQFYYKKFKDVEPAIGLDFFYREIYLWDDCSPTKCCYEMFENIIKPGDIVLDLGANIGLFTRKVAQIASKVIAVEASPEHFSCLIENTSEFNNVECVNALVVGDNNPGDINTVWSNKSSRMKITIQEIMKMYNLDRIDFIKMDIEGGEYDLLNNTPVEVLDKIDKISCEMHGSFFPNEPNKDQDFYLPNKVKNSWTWFFNNGLDSETFFYFKNFN